MARPGIRLDVEPVQRFRRTSGTKTCAHGEDMQMRKNDRRECLFPALEELQSGPNPIAVQSKSKQALTGYLPTWTRVCFAGADHQPTRPARYRSLLSTEQRTRFLRDSIPSIIWLMSAAWTHSRARAEFGPLQAIYLQANLHPDRFPTLRDAPIESHRLRADAPASMQIRSRLSVPTG